ncbi:hypothetical protein Tco_1383633 [Tanacetum coccineum]
MFDEYITPPAIVVPPVQEAVAPRAVDLADSLVSTSIDKDAPLMRCISHLEELHVTWAHLEKKRTRLRTYTNITQDNALSSWRRRHQYNVTPSQRRPRRRHRIS